MVEENLDRVKIYRRYRIRKRSSGKNTQEPVSVKASGQTRGNIKGGVSFSEKREEQRKKKKKRGLLNVGARAARGGPKKRVSALKASQFRGGSVCQGTEDGGPGGQSKEGGTWWCKEGKKTDSPV